MQTAVCEQKALFDVAPMGDVPALSCDNGVTSETQAERREIVKLVLAAAKVRYKHKRRADNIEACSSRAWKFLIGSAGATVRMIRCRERLCPTCAKINAAKVAAALSHVLDGEYKAGERLLMFTLTVQHTPADRLAWLRKLLTKAWARLIRRKWWRDNIGAYHRVVEVELTTGGGWHPHFHVLVRVRKGSKLHPTAVNKVQQQLKEIWLEITSKLGRPSYMADVRKLNREGIVAELCKYITKRTTGSKAGQLSLFDYSPAQLDEYIQAVKGWRLHQSSRVWSAIEREYNEQRDAEPPETGEDTVELGWDEVKFMAEKGAAGDMLDAEAETWKRTGAAIKDALEANGCVGQARYLGRLLERFAAVYSYRLDERRAIRQHDPGG